MSKNGKSDDEIRNYMRKKSLVEKCQMVSEEVTKLDPSIRKPIIDNMKRLRNELVHFKGDNDWNLFNEISLESLLETENNIAVWMETVEKLVGIARHPNTKGLLDPLSNLGKIEHDESSEP